MSCFPILIVSFHLVCELYPAVARLAAGQKVHHMRVDSPGECVAAMSHVLAQSQPAMIERQHPLCRSVE